MNLNKANRLSLHYTPYQLNKRIRMLTAPEINISQIESIFVVRSA